jgi:hypothetical protein
MPKPRPRPHSAEASKSRWNRTREHIHQSATPAELAARTGALLLKG